jgi:hypothetical protein
MVNAFGVISQSFVIQRALYEKLDAAASESDLVGFRAAMSDAAVMYQQSSKLLITVAVLAVASSVVPDRDDPKNHVVLNLSTEEKAALIQALRSRFGEKPSTANADTGPAQAAKLMLHALNKEWRLAK